MFLASFVYTAGHCPLEILDSERRSSTSGIDDLKAAGQLSRVGLMTGREANANHPADLSPPTPGWSYC